MFILFQWLNRLSLFLWSFTFYPFCWPSQNTPCDSSSHTNCKLALCFRLWSKSEFVKLIFWKRCICTIRYSSCSGPSSPWCSWVQSLKTCVIFLGIIPVSFYYHYDYDQYHIELFFHFYKKVFLFNLWLYNHHCNHYAYWYLFLLFSVLILLLCFW